MHTSNNSNFLSIIHKIETKFLLQLIVYIVATGLIIGNIWIVNTNRAVIHLVERQNDMIDNMRDVIESNSIVLNTIYNQIQSNEERATERENRTGERRQYVNTRFANIENGVTNISRRLLKLESKKMVSFYEVLPKPQDLQSQQPVIQQTINNDNNKLKVDVQTKVQ